MNELTKDRTVVYLDTNSLHYLDLFVQYLRAKGLTVDDVGSRELATQIEKVREIGYKKSLKKGCRIISFVLQEDAQVEFSQVSKIELLCGRVRGAVIENAAKQGIPDRMWSRIGEYEIRDGSNELRPAVEPESPGAALRAHPPDRPDRDVPSLEPGGGRGPQGRRLPPVYFKQQSRTVVVLLAGGDKRTQSRDIDTAMRLSRDL